MHMQQNVVFVARAAVVSMIEADGSSDDSGPDGSARSRGRILNYMHMYHSRVSCSRLKQSY